MCAKPISLILAAQMGHDNTLASTTQHEVNGTGTEDDIGPS